MSRQDLEERGRGLFEVLSLHFPDVTEKSEARILPNTRQERIPHDRHVPSRACLHFCGGNGLQIKTGQRNVTFLQLDTDYWSG